VQDCWNQDVESFSHEAAEWADDPFGQNPQPCGEHLDVADPLSGFLFHYYTHQGANGLPYTLQDLVFLPYFGAPAGTSYNGQTTFQA
jgi:hypothetical protein